MTQEEARKAMVDLILYFKQLDDEYCGKPHDEDRFDRPMHHREARNFAHGILGAANVDGLGGCLLCQS